MIAHRPPRRRRRSDPSGNFATTGALLRGGSEDEVAMSGAEGHADEHKARHRRRQGYDGRRRERCREACEDDRLGREPGRATQRYIRPSANSELIRRSPSAGCNVDPNFELRDGMSRHFLKGNSVFKDTTHLIIKHTDRGATDREHSWAQAARNRRRVSARRASTPPWRDETMAKDSEMLQWERNVCQISGLKLLNERRTASRLSGDLSQRSSSRCATAH